MRAPPKPVAPVVHAGVCYQVAEAAHLRPPKPPGPPTLMARIHAALKDGDATNAVWVRSTLQAAGFSAAEIAPVVTFVELKDQVDVLLKQAVSQVSVEAISSEPQLMFSAAWAREALKKAPFTPEQVEHVAQVWEAEAREVTHAEEPLDIPSGGYIAAVDAATGATLWTLMVYQTEYDPDLERCIQSVFITDLAVRDGSLWVRDERRQTHRVDLASRQVVDVIPAGGPRPAEVARAFVRCWDPALQRQLFDDFGDFKDRLDKATFHLRPDPETMPIFVRMVKGIQPHAAEHPLLERAFQRGVELYRAGGPPDGLYGWLQDDASFLFTELFALFDP